MHERCCRSRILGEQVTDDSWIPSTDLRIRWLRGGRPSNAGFELLLTPLEQFMKTWDALLHSAQRKIPDAENLFPDYRFSLSIFI